MNQEEIKNLITELIGRTTIKLENISIDNNLGDTDWYSLEVSDPHFFINNNGEALHALNHLIRRIIESKNLTTPLDIQTGDNTPDKLDILIDVNDFQKKRVENVRAVAHMMSERARFFKSNIEIDPMSAFERRIVHEFLSNATDLKTESVGFGSSRRVVIKYVGDL